MLGSSWARGLGLDASRPSPDMLMPPSVAILLDVQGAVLALKIPISLR
jgi:hypothetical protein